MLIHKQLAVADERVYLVIDHIKNNYHQQGINPQVLGNLVFLSPSRLSSLFKQQTGSSMSKYLLWTRLRHAITRLLLEKDHSLTEIAFKTGFYDLPQLGKYMSEMFGISPTDLRKNSDLIQVSET